MSKIKVFCFGFGQVAKYFVRKIIKENKSIELNISSRQKTHPSKFEGLDLNSYELSDNKIDKNITSKIQDADYILVSIPPVNDEDIVVKNFKETIKKTNLKWITYLSATSVYGNHNGAWVNENSETKPSSANGIKRLKAENQWLKFSNENNLPLQIFRLSGIYSAENNILKRLISGQTKVVKKENHFFSRIHVKDISEILYLSLINIKENQIFNLADNKPASSVEVTSYASKLLGCELPTKINFEDLEEGVLKDFYRDSKKVSNEKVKKELNYEFIYPSYKEGLAQ